MAASWKGFSDALIPKQLATGTQFTSRMSTIHISQPAHVFTNRMNKKVLQAAQHACNSSQGIGVRMPRTQAVLATRLPMPVVTNSVSFTARCGTTFAAGNSSPLSNTSPIPSLFLLAQAKLYSGQPMLLFHKKLEPDRDLLSFIYPKWEFSCYGVIQLSKL